MPDSWAIKQLFPIMPIHRLEEQPTRHAVLGDISCDSDGKVDQFIDRRDVKKTLPLHHSNGQAVLSWARSCSAPIRRSSATCTICSATPTRFTCSLGENGEVILDAVIKGDTVREVLDYVQFNATMLLEQFRRDVEASVAGGADRLRGIGPAAAVLRRGPERLHVPGGCGRRRLARPTARP